jgi:biotin transport system substrate-specific component
MPEVGQPVLTRYLALRSDSVIAQGFWIVTFAFFTTVGAQLEIPHYPVPYTFQTFFVLLAGGLLGKRNGFLSMMTYLGIGAIGLPVFAGSSFGIARLLGPSGGYLISFPFAAFLIAFLISMRPKFTGQLGGTMKRFAASFAWTVGSMIVGLLFIFAIGTLQLNAVYFHNWTSSFLSGFMIFSWWDVLKLTAAAAICNGIDRA